MSQDSKALFWDAIIHDKILEMSEKEFTTIVLIPLMKALGHFKVEYHGGAYEDGKDLICWLFDELDNIQLSVTQVKLFKPNASSANSKSFGHIVTQLSQAAEKKVPYTDGNYYYPTIVYFVTPYQVDVRALQSRFESFNQTKNFRIKILDGSTILRLLKQKLPNLIRDLIGTTEYLKINQINKLSNIDLLNALNVQQNERDITLFYCDLDFSMGRINSKIFFNLDTKDAVQKKVKIYSIFEWEDFTKITDKTEKFFCDKIITPDVITIEKNYIAANEKYHEIKKKIEEKESDIFKLIRNISDNQTSIKNRIDNIKILKRTDKLTIKSKDIEVYEKFYCLVNYSSLFKDIKKDSKIIDILYRGVQKVKSIETRMSGNYEILETLQNIEKILQYVKNLRVELRKSTSSLFKPCFKFKIEGTVLAAQIVKNQNWLKAKILEINNHKLSFIELKKFLLKCEKLFELVDDILLDPYLSNCVGLNPSIRYSNLEDHGFPRLQISIHDIFDTRLNISLFGEAGAGKTTTLQVYAKQKTAAEFSKSFVIYIPLTRIVNLVDSKIEILLLNENYLEIIEKLIEDYFNEMGVNLPLLNLQNIFSAENSTLLLDGIDEVIRTAPWILESIKSLNSKYPNLQLITSSRMTGEYLDEIPFLGITLLPFTDGQRAQFLNNWFNIKNDTQSALKILDHLDNEPEIDKIVRTPLLATILCVLVEYNIPLPQNEVHLYEERFNLLFGHYDIHKKANRISSHRHNLERTARKIAFYLHYHGKRYDHKDAMIKEVSKYFEKFMLKDEIYLAVEELIDPCNILVPMTKDGQLGFGHLRYQEYLVACELINNRGINIASLLHKTWWRGTLVLFSMLTDDLSFLKTSLIHIDETAKETISAMIQIRSINDRERLKKLFEINRE